MLGSEMSLGEAAVRGCEQVSVVSLFLNYCNPIWVCIKVRVLKRHLTMNDSCHFRSEIKLEGCRPRGRGWRLSPPMQCYILFRTESVEMYLRNVFMGSTSLKDASLYSWVVHFRNALLFLFSVECCISRESRSLKIGVH